MRKLVSSLHGLTKRQYLCAHRIPFSPLPPRHWFSSSCARSFPAEDHPNTQASSTSITGQDDSHSTTTGQDDSHASSTTTTRDDSHASPSIGQDDSHSSSTTTITRDDSHASPSSITTGQDDTRTSAVDDPIDKILQELESKRREADVNGRKVEMSASDDTASSSRAPSHIFSTPEHCAVETREQLAQRPVEANFELLDPHVKPSNPRALLIDGTPLVVRAYHGTPPMNTCVVGV